MPFMIGKMIHKKSCPAGAAFLVFIQVCYSGLSLLREVNYCQQGTKSSNSTKDNVLIMSIW
jgi:hypothetical protein